MALQLPGIQYLQGYDQNPDIVGKFKGGYEFGAGIRNEADAQDALGEYVKSLYMSGGQAQQPAQAPAIPPNLVGGSVNAATGTAPWMGEAVEQSDYLANLRARESGGNDAAKNPNSSATGRYQFTEPTWQGLMQNHPELGLTPDGRLDPAQQDRAVAVLTRENATALKSKGLPINPGTLYAAHFLGAPQASEVLGYADTTPLVSALPPEVIQANPNLQNMTVGDFKQWTAQTGGNGQGGYQAPMDMGIAQAPQAGSAAPANGLPPREVMAKLFANPTTRGFAAELVKAKQTGTDPTDDMREYAFAASQGFDGSFADWQAANKSGVTVNTGDNGGADAEFYRAGAGARGKQFADIETAGYQAQGKIGQIGRLEQLLGSAPQGVEGAWKQFAGELGFDSEGLDDIQAAQALINKLVPEQRMPGTGPMSDADLALFKQSMPRIINQPGGNALIIQTLKGVAVYEQQMGEIAGRVLNREITPAQGREEMAAVANPFDTFKAATQSGADEAPEGVDPELWKFMSAEDKALWQ
jgi:hypothetical protein